MSRCFPIALMTFVLLPVTAQVSAFCIQNDSQQRLFFEVGDYGIHYRKWIAPGSMACCDWRQENCNWTRAADGRLSVRLFARRVDGAVADCSYTVRADGYLRLRRFSPPGQCRWEP